MVFTLSASVWAMNSGSLPMLMDRCTPLLYHLIHRADDPRSEQGGINLDAWRLSVELVEDVEGAELAPGPQRVRHEVAAHPRLG